MLFFQDEQLEEVYSAWLMARSHRKMGIMIRANVIITPLTAIQDGIVSVHLPHSFSTTFSLLVDLHEIVERDFHCIIVAMWKLEWLSGPDGFGKARIKHTEQANIIATLDAATHLLEQFEDRDKKREQKQQSESARAAQPPKKRTRTKSESKAASAKSDAKQAPPDANVQEVEELLALQHDLQDGLADAVVLGEHGLQDQQAADAAIEAKADALLRVGHVKAETDDTDVGALVTIIMNASFGAPGPPCIANFLDSLRTHCCHVRSMNPICPSHRRHHLLLLLNLSRSIQT